MITFATIIKAAFNFVFGLQLETLPPPEDERRRPGAVDGTPAAAVNAYEEWDVLAYPPPYFALSGKVPTHILTTWR
ncbi:hypothetical protein BV20DRAFT_1122326 [Pilatotrama ljubarskyi]|nr:hypothetical protein BV20DRAFT_1122326 [Pilatotrama ljubarskyi]